MATAGESALDFCNVYRNKRRGLGWYPLLAIALALPLAAQSAPSSTSFALHDGDRVDFYGDSITAQREYTRDVEDYVLTRFPQWKLTFINSGVGGDRVSGGYAGPVDLRLDRDVFAYHPNVVTIMLGMNDGYYRPAQPGIASTYEDGYRHLVQSIKEHLPDARITLIQPSPYDDVTRTPLFPGGYNGVLLEYSGFLAQLSREQQTGLADLNTPVTAMLATLKEQAPGLSQQLIPDRVHPQEGGHWIMAEALLRAWGAPAVVSSVTLDAGSAKSVKMGDVANATLSDLHAGKHGASKDGLSWTETEAALPLPLPPAATDPTLGLVVKLSDLVKTLDRETLAVQGLAPGQYSLKIDGRPIGSFSAAELSAGLNLATLQTPMLEQALLVDADTRRKNTLEDAHFNVIYKTLADESSATAKALQQALPAAVDRQREDAQPRPHHFELTPASSAK